MAQIHSKTKPDSEFGSFTENDRVEHLKGLLDDPRWKIHRENILGVIRWYEEGNKLSYESHWFVNGQLCEQEPKDLYGKAFIWEERICDQMMQSVQDPPEFFDAQSAARGTIYLPLRRSRMHEIKAQFRLPSRLGGNDQRIIDVSIANDTGSDLQCILPSDLEGLGYDEDTYAMGRLANTTLRFADGRIDTGVQTIRIDIRLMQDESEDEPIGDWFPASAVFASASQKRLSGNDMRDNFYFATAPGNHHLFVAETKTKLAELMR